MEHFKYNEIKEFFNDRIQDFDKDWIESNLDDLHHEIFNTDYYIIGTYKAEQWLEDHVFEVMRVIKEYEDLHFGESIVDISEPEKVVNMYTYIVGEEIVNDYIQENFKEVA